jgi:gentisate 1,2-dioxygenase
MGGTTHTLLMGIQMIKPGEIAWAHRHTLAAIRFVIKGDGKVYSVVDGEKCPMEPNDLILTHSGLARSSQSDKRNRHLG